MSTALLLVDVIHDFFHPQGKNYFAGYERVKEHIASLLQTARGGEKLIVHAREWHRTGPDYEQPKLPLHCLENSWDVEFPEWVGRGEGELEVRKRRYSAFFTTDLDLLLRERGIRRLIVAGVKTHVCIRATIQDAFAYGYEVVLPREATGSNRTHLVEPSLEDIDRYFGRVTAMDEALNLLQGRS